MTARLSLLLGVLVAATTIGLEPAHADASVLGVTESVRTESDFVVTKFGQTKSGKATTTMAEQYTKSRSHKELGAKLKEEFLADAARNGMFFDADSVDYLRFEHETGEAAEIVTSRGRRVNEVHLGSGNQIDPRSGKKTYVVSAGVDTSDTGEDGGLAYPSGPGFSNLSWVNGGPFKLTTSKGTLDFRWDKYKDKTETNTSKDYWGYKRWAVATPKDIVGWDDDVWSMGMRSYPTSSSRNILRGWVALSPLPGEYDGDCGTPLQVGVSNVAVSFTPCEEYRIDWNSNAADAGDMSFTWNNTWPYPTTGVQSMAAVFEVNSAQGSQPYYNDYFFVNFRAHCVCGVPGYNTGCGSTGRSATCS